MKTIASSSRDAIRASITRRTFLTGLLATGALAILPARANPPPLRFGVTPVMLDDRIGFLNDWSDWLGERLDRPVVFVQRARYREILDLLLRGQLDLAWICGYPYVQHQAALELLAAPSFQGRPLYHSYVIAAADSPARTLEELAGQLFAWADSDSNSGYLYPRFHLTSRGHDPERFFRRTFFTWGHPRSVTAVAEGLADGAAVDGYVWETLARRNPSLTAATRVILRSPAFGFPPLVAGPALPAAERARIRDILLDQSRDPAGRALLAELDLDGFVPVEPALYADIADMARQPARSDPA
jgi:phosphonate transport system substrate-binding protein